MLVWPGIGGWVDGSKYYGWDGWGGVAAGMAVVAVGGVAAGDIARIGVEVFIDKNFFLAADT